jgi:hypothetical protein
VFHPALIIIIARNPLINLAIDYSFLHGNFLVYEIRNLLINTPIIDQKSIISVQVHSAQTSGNRRYKHDINNTIW